MSKRPQRFAVAGALAMTIIAGSLSIPAASANVRVIVVRPGQTLSQIAAEHGVSVARLVDLNDLPDPDLIYAGQRLRVRAAEPGANGGGHEAGDGPRVVTHHVSFGETLTAIAARYGTTIDAIVWRNLITDPSRIYAGQVLRIPGGWDRHARHRSGDGRTHRPPTFARHIVRYGETLSGIALRYGVSMDRLVTVNGIANPSFIRAGDAIRIPGRRPDRSGQGHTGQRHSTSRHAAPSRDMPSQMRALVRSRADIRRLIATEARRQGVPRAFALAVAWQESGWQPSVVSSAGAIGVMQLLPSTADWVSATMLGEPVDPWNPQSNIRAGVRLLRHYLDRYHGSRQLALAAYYQGQTATDLHGIYPVSQAYIGSILLLQDMFRP